MPNGQILNGVLPSEGKGGAGGSTAGPTVPSAILGKSSAISAKVFSSPVITEGRGSAGIARTTTPPVVLEGREAPGRAVIVPAPGTGQCPPCEPCPPTETYTVVVGQEGSTDTRTCWDGSGTTAMETALAATISDYKNLDDLRLALMQALTTTAGLPGTACRALIQTAFSTEIVVVPKLFYSPSNAVLGVKICDKRSYQKIDGLLDSKKYLLSPALDELQLITTLPIEYVTLLKEQTGAVQPINRVAAAAAIVLTAVAALAA